MKKSLTIGMIATAIFALTSCGEAAVEGAMDHAAYESASLKSSVLVATYVQDKEAYYNGKATVYAQSKDGAYFVYDAPMSQTTYDSLKTGTRIKVEGTKSEWSGEVEITDPTITVLGDGSYVASAYDCTSLMGDNTKLIKHQNELVSFKNLTVVDYDGYGAYAYDWNNAGSRGSHVYFELSDGTNNIVFNVRSYLRDKDTDVYKAAEALKVGEKVNVEGFLYWYEGAAQPRVTSISVVK